MKIKGKILVPHVYLLTFQNQYELCMSFVRMQEFYESPKLRNKYFTLEQYMDYWSEYFGDGVFTYTSEWNGFNLPGAVIASWYEKFASEESDIREREKNILRAISKLMQREFFNDVQPSDTQKIYVIGVHGNKGNNLTIQHELAHAMYYLNPDYKKSCLKLLRDMDRNVYLKGKQWLLNKGYCQKVIDDELQAYFSTNDSNCSSIKGLEEFSVNFEAFKKSSEKNN